MKCKKLLALMLAIFFVAGMFTACGARAPEADYNSSYDAPAAMPEEAPMVPSDMLTDSSQSSQMELPTDRKLIITVNMDAETEDLDATLAHVNAKITDLNGYMESQEINNGSAYSTYRHRSSNMTIRIPAENLSQFVDMVSENCNIVSNYRTSEDVTLQYVSLESRIEALEIEQDRLLALLEQADNMEDLLTIEARLTDVRYDLEQIHSQMLVMKNRINYSTVHLYLREVIEYTEVEEEPETFFQRISRGFTKSVKGVWNGIVEFVIFLISALPYLVLFGGIAVVIILIIRKRRKNHPRKKTKSKDETPE